VDPNTALARIRELAKKAHADEGTEDAHEFVALVEYLDEWMSKGGFAPAAWTSATPPLGELTTHDHILTRAGIDLDGPVLPYAMGLSMHLCPDTPIFVRLHKREHRAVVQFGYARAETALFTDADQVERLAVLFAHVRDRLT
jgi:hypothetical protein